MKNFYLIIITILFTSNIVFAQEQLTAQNGVLDLRTWNWQKDGIVDLNGDWEFYWQKFYTPSFFKTGNADSLKHYAFLPDFWNADIPDKNNAPEGFGFATYHLKILCPPIVEKLSMKFLTVGSAYRLFINGKEMLNVGNAGTTASSTIPDLMPLIIDVEPENNELDIVIQVSNFDNRIGGLWDFIKLGDENQIHSYRVQNISLELFVAGSFFLAGIYYFILFLSFKKRYALLCFSLLCFLIFIRSVVTGEMAVLYLTNFSWLFARRMEYITFYLSVPIMSLFSYYLFPQEFSKKILYIILSVCGAFVAVSLFASYYIFTYPLPWYQAVMLLAACYGLYVYASAAKNKRRGSLLFLLGFIVFIITIANDILYANLIINSVPLFYVGLFLFTIILSVLLSGQFGKIFADLQVVNTSLHNANKELGIMNEEIKEKNAELKKINDEMDDFVARTTHDLRAPLASVLGLISMVREEKNIDRFNRYFSLQEETLKRMNNLIKNLMDFSVNKRSELELGEIDFKKIIENSLNDHAFVDHTLRMQNNVSIIQKEKFISDAGRLTMIINNLISNAIKYADPKKENIEIDITISVKKKMATIEIKDNGIGIDNHHLDKIFTLFYRATTRSAGSGLGLYIVKETVEMLKGNIKA
ncbi:MAG: sensor histidine kinase, partial [Parafilimonas sp.]